MDPEILHRIQFAFTITFHYIYPPLSIGLSLLLIIYEYLYLKTGSPLWEQVTKFWTKVFALTFALGIATGVPLLFSFGTNWARYSHFIGDILGSALASEGLFAFGMEASFLGIVLFGWGRVSKKMHFIATCLVSLGAHMSGFWIVTVNSWMHTPAGYALMHNEKGVEYAVVTNWYEVIFNPSNIPHFVHVILGAWLTGSLLVVSISAYYLMKNRYRDFAIASVKIAGVLTLFAAILQLLSADTLAQVIAKENPTKLAAFEGTFRTEESSTAYLYGIVDVEKKTVHGFGIPGGLSFLVHNDFKTPVSGLDKYPKEDWPNIQLVFQVYHVMVLTWALIAAAALIVLFLWYKNRWKAPKAIMYFLIASASFPQIGNIAGWYSSCLGRQPWTVYKLLRTKDAYSRGISSEEALFSLIFFIILYLAMFGLFLFLLTKKVHEGPEPISKNGESAHGL